ncbi:hypothetical protein P389DRAFT_11847 [Cystobasidium minutum MCA 4210]|uniref:uncharacterized protein n=1 Tax=Cystobasidium minutum MCA 4210 TaxID=1397322 RepID=UPI0034CE53E1|eukprot:jgi/Rhomi1/11847/CE11846_9228
MTMVDNTMHPNWIKLATIHLRSQSGHSGYTYPDSAYAIAGSRSRVETAESTLQPGKRIAPPQYGAPPPPPRPVGTAPLPPPTMNTVNPQQQQHAGYNQMQDHNYPTYTNGNAAPHDGKPVLPADEMGRGWLGFNMQDIRDLSPKAKKRLIWVGVLAIVVLIIIILFEVFKDDFERWVTPLRDWLREREAWSWVIPVAVLIVLSIPPLAGHEVVQIVVGLAYPLGVGIGIAIAGAILGEALCFILFKYALSERVRRKTEQKVSWAAVARVSQEAGFKGVMIIRYSVVPPHLANPIFATTGMSFGLYMLTVVLSLPKQIIFVVLGDPSAKGKTGAKIGKVVAVGVLVIVTLLGTRWISRRIAIAKKEIEAERNADVAAKQRQLGIPVDVEHPGAQIEAMSDAERREWEQQREMDRERMNKNEQQTSTYLQEP